MRWYEPRLFAMRGRHGCPTNRNFTFTVVLTRMQDDLPATATAMATPMPSKLAESLDTEDGGTEVGEAAFVENAPVSELIALMPRAIAALSDQVRIGEGGEPLDGRSPVLLASSILLATVNFAPVF
jgi:hypothetical protein